MMTDEQIRQWIEACNHEPAREVLRDYMRLRAADRIVVPREPTPGMRQAGGEANCPTISLTTACDYAVDVYRAMLVAVPRNFLEAIRDEDLNEPISDAGHTVGDGLKADARRYLGGPTKKKKCIVCSGKGEVTWETTFCEYERGKCPECNGKGFK
jgi:hypothetical protein